MSDFLQKSLEASRAAQAVVSLRKDLLNAKSKEDCLRIVRSAEELKGLFSTTYSSSFDGVVAEAHKRMVEIEAGNKQEGQPPVAAEMSALREETRKAREQNANDAAETHRLLHRATRKLDGVPPVIQKLEIATHSMAKATIQFMQQIKLDELHWEIYDRIEQKNQNQTAVARELGMKPYQVSRAWKLIRDTFTAAGYPIAKKFTLRSAKLDTDGMLVAKTAKKRKR